MVSNRTLVVMVGALGAAGVLVAAASLLAREDTPPATGELIAYSCKEPKNPWYAICVVGIDGADSTRLTSQVSTTDPAWSPDGRQIAFTRRESVGEYTTLSEDDVYVMDADGGGERQLTDEAKGRHAGQPSWSPDGRHIVFVRGESVPTAVPARPGELFVMTADGSEVRPLTRGSRDLRPAWSPDGRQVVFTRALEPPYAGLWVVDATGGRPRQLTDPARYVDESAVWSPDGTRIAFTRTRPESEYDGVASVHVMNRDGTNVRELVRHRYFSCCTYGLAWSPDGRTIAFETSPARNCTAISLVDVASGHVRPLTSCTRPRESSLSPAWQPDTTAGSP